MFDLDFFCELRKMAIKGIIPTLDMADQYNEELKELQSALKLQKLVKEDISKLKLKMVEPETEFGKDYSTILLTLQSLIEDSEK